MKLLLISYSFGAGRGSEAGVGWNVARGMCERGHDVTVVTTSEFHHLNAPAVAQMERPPRLIEWDCGITHFASSRSYRIWQRRIEAPLRELCRRERFDLAHHVTFNQYRHIHDVFATGLPYLIGPVGGAETIPLRLWRDLPWSTRFKELLRRIPWDVRLLTRRVRHSKSRGLILASTPQTLDRLTHTGGLSNVELMPIISIASNEIRDDAPTPADEPYLIFDGGLRPEKGLRMLLRSLAALYREGESIPLRIAAVRPEDQGTLLALARSCGLPEQWLQPMPFMKRSELLPIIRSARGFVSVGFRDAGCMALRSMPMPEGRRASLCAVVSIAGFLDVPLVFFSARLWRSIHPSVFASQGGGLEPEMAVTVAACVMSFFFIWLAMLLLRYRQRLLSRRLDELFFERMMEESENEQH